jgi:hypothetical protein
MINPGQSIWAAKRMTITRDPRHQEGADDKIKKRNREQIDDKINDSPNTRGFVVIEVVARYNRYLQTDAKLSLMVTVSKLTLASFYTFLSRVSYKANNLCMLV